MGGYPYLVGRKKPPGGKGRIHMMTKKDYTRAAKIVDGISEASHAWTVRESFVILFAGDNPRFDADRFREACGKVAQAHRPTD